MNDLIELYPDNEYKFLKELLRTKKAKRIFYLKNGTIKEEIWIANKLTIDSNVLWNIKTNNTFRKLKQLDMLKKVKIEILEN